MTHHKGLNEASLGSEGDGKKGWRLLNPNTNRASPANDSCGTHPLPLSDGRDLVGLEEFENTLAMVCVVDAIGLAMGTGHFR